MSCLDHQVICSKFQHHFDDILMFTSKLTLLLPFSIYIIFEFPPRIYSFSRFFVRLKILKLDVGTCTDSFIIVSFTSFPCLSQMVSSRSTTGCFRKRYFGILSYWSVLGQIRFVSDSLSLI